MADASQALGAPQLAGTWVNHRGMAKKVTATAAGGQLGGAVGAVAAQTIVGRSPDPAPAELPEFGRDAYLAASADELALVKTKQGLMKLKITDEVIARAPNSDVSSAELGTGKLACPLAIVFSSGARWEFDVPRAGKSAAEKLVKLLSA